MFVVHQFEARVIQLSGTSSAIVGATVSLTPEAIGAPVTGTWDAVRGVYHFDGVPPGFFELQVSAAGFTPLTRRVQVHPKRTLEVVRMIPTTDAGFGAALPPQSLHDTVGVFPRRRAAPGTDAPSPADVGGALARAGFVRVPPPTDAPATALHPDAPFLAQVVGDGLARGTDARLAALRQDPAIRAAGPVLHVEEEVFSIVVNSLDVRFRNEVSRRERDALLASLGLEVAAERNVGTPAYQLLAPSGAGLEVFQLAKALRDTGRVEYAEATILTRWSVDAPVVPTDPLWPGCWDRQTSRVDEAWELLQDDLGTDATYGDANLILGVMDTGIESSGGTVVNPDWTGTVTSGASKIYQLYDFDLGVPNNDTPLTGSNHGVQVAGVCGALADNVDPQFGTAVGLPGAAPNVQLMGLIGSWAPGWVETVNADAYRWSTGISNVGDPGLPAPIAPGADVMTCSLTFGSGNVISSVAHDAIDQISRRARNGRGALLYFSAGNSPVQNVETYRPWGHHERAFSCAGSTLDNAGVEIRYGSSGKGQVEWCAPTNSGSPPHDPPSVYRTWGGDFLHRGNLPSVAAVTTPLTAASAAGTTSVVVAESSQLVAGTWAMVGVPGTDAWENVLISAVDTGTDTVTISSLKNDHAAGEAFVAGGRALTTVPGGVSIGDPTITVADGTTLSDGDTVNLGTSTGAESYQVTGLAGNTFTPTPVPTLAHPADAVLWEGGCHHDNQFGGTSSATPLAAGIGALVLSARPRLTWVEAAWLMQQSAVHIQEGNTDPEGQWLDANGDQVTVVGGEVVMGAPEFSRHFGHGRLDARNAVAAALAYDYPRDLMIRNALTDDGSTAQTGPLDSPDIWVRNEDPATDAGKYPAGPTVAGPHEDPSYSDDRWIYARVRNRGSMTSLKAWVRFYVAADPGADFAWPADFSGINGVGNIDVANWDAGTYFLGEVGIENVPPGGDTIVNLPWPRELLPPPVTTGGTAFDPVILVEITPHDGPLEGATVHENNNLAQRGVTVLDNDAPEVSFFGPGGADFPRSVEIPSTSPGGVATPFEIHVLDLGVFVTESVSFTVTWTGRDGSTTAVDYAHDGTNWTESAPAPGTFAIGTPVDADGNPVSGNTLEARYQGSLDAHGQFESLRIEVLAADVSGNTTAAADATRLVQLAIPTDVMLVLDYSGSMNRSNDAGQTRWVSATEAANLFNAVYGTLAQTNGLDDRIGLVRFWATGPGGVVNETEVTAPLATPDASAPLVTASAPTWGNQTPIGSGVLTAANALGAGGSSWRSRIALLLTDGQENVAPDIEEIRTASAGSPNFVPSVEDDPQDGLRIHSCAFGTAADIDTASIEALAEGTDGDKSYGGVFHATSSTADPFAAFALKEQLLSMLADSMTAELIGPFDSSVTIEPGVDEVVLLVTDAVAFGVTPPPEHTGAIPATQTQPGVAWLRVTDPTPGTWTLTGFAPSSTVRAFAVVDLTLRASFRIGSTGVGVGLPLPLFADIHEGGVPISGARVTARIEGPDESVGQLLATQATAVRKTTGPMATAVASTAPTAARTGSVQAEPIALRSELLTALTKGRGFGLRRFTRTITLHETAPGSYGATWNSTHAEGTYTVYFHAEGTTRDGRPFQRDYVSSRYLVPAPDPGLSVVSWAQLTPALWQAILTPRTAAGRLLGPGVAGLLKLQTSTGQAVEVQDREDGSYAVQIRDAKQPPQLSFQLGGTAVPIRTASAPVHRVRVAVERIAVEDAKEAWFQSPGELSFRSVATVDEAADSAVVRSIPTRGVLKLRDGEATCTDVVLFDGLVREGSELALQITGSEADSLFGITLSRDPMARYRRVLRGPVSGWAGSYGPSDEEGGDLEDLADWKLWFTVEVL